MAVLVSTMLLVGMPELMPVASAMHKPVKILIK